MLPSQRALFDIPQNVCYLNAAAVGPLPRAVKQAGERGAASKAQPWAIPDGNAQRQFERARAAAARLINAEPDDVALISSVRHCHRRQGAERATRQPRAAVAGRPFVAGAGMAGPGGCAGFFRRGRGAPR